MVDRLGITTRETEEMTGLVYGAIESDRALGSPRSRRDGTIEEWKRWLTQRNSNGLFLGIAISLLFGLILMATTWGDTMSEIDNLVPAKGSLTFGSMSAFEAAKAKLKRDAEKESAREAKERAREDAFALSSSAKASHHDNNFIYRHGMPHVFKSELDLAGNRAE